MKKVWKHIEIFFILVSLMILIISSLFRFDNNAIMGFDKLIADIIITGICYFVNFYLSVTHKSQQRDKKTVEQAVNSFIP